jgi:zinc-ribbon domain
MADCKACGSPLIDEVGLYCGYCNAPRYALTSWTHPKEFATVSVHSIHFELSEWDMSLETRYQLSFAEKNARPDILHVFFFPYAPNIPVGLTQLADLRDFCRAVVRGTGSGLIATEVVAVKGVPTVKTLFKLPLVPPGMIYVGTLTFPFVDFSFLITVQCGEQGVTGVRESVVADRFLTAAGAFDPSKGFPKGWFQDPYDPTRADPIMRNQADDEQYDARFPDHPLSRVRRHLSRIEASLKFDDYVLRCAPFRAPRACANPACGRPLREGVKFCTHCGQRVATAAQVKEGL